MLVYFILQLYLYFVLITKQKNIHFIFFHDLDFVWIIKKKLKKNPLILELVFCLPVQLYVS